jgi:hypothetical protein
MAKEYPPGRVKPPRPPSPEDYLNKKKPKWMNNLDRIDYQRTIAGRGDTHALEGGTTPARYASLVGKAKEMLSLYPQLNGWEDRNPANNGTKLNFRIS